MRIIILVSFSVVLLSTVEARGAGRAFPIDSENYVIERFSSINSRLEWDPTNFLVDLAGKYTNCDAAGSEARVFDVDAFTPDGYSISGVVDSINGDRSDVDAVNSYIQGIIDRWLSSRKYDYLVRGANRFGCSVRPGCRGVAVVSCLFSPGDRGNQGDQGNGLNDKPDNIIEVNAQAFTPEQYKIAELFTGNAWDRSHFLENLSGSETKCAMIGEDNWPFTNLRKIEAVFGYRITPIYGSAPNQGSTQEALDKILQNFKQIRNAAEVGCSLIPDCTVGSQMYVVVTCLYRAE